MSVPIEFLLLLLLGGVGIGEGVWAGVLPRPSREAILRLQQAQEAISQGRIAEAIPILEQILTGAEEGYVPVESSGGVHLPLKRAAGRVVESLTPEGQASFEAWCSGKAARRLDEALAQRDRRALARIVCEYPTTGFAAEAALALAADAWDRRQFAESLRWAQKTLEIPAAAKNVQAQALLLRAAHQMLRGQPARARQSLEQLRSLVPSSGLRVGTVEGLSPASPERILEAIAEAAVSSASKETPEPTPSRNWPMFRGNPARNASSDWTGQVGELRWRLEMERLEEPRRPTPSPVHVGGSSSFAGGNLPAVHPVVDGRLCLVRLPSRFVAVDLISGRQIWEYPWGGDLSVWRPSAPNPSGAVFVGGFSPQGLLARQRLLEDAPYGQVVASGDRLYLVDGLGLASNLVFPVVRPGTTSPRPPRPSNRLVALDLRKEGKVLWSVGSSSGEDEPALREAFFLGPPLPVDGVLYGVVEQEGEIRLVALAEPTGQRLWSLPIAVPERDIASDPMRRLAGAMPSYAEGVLVCPTSAGALVAVDPWTQSVLWAYEVPLSETSLRSMRVQMLMALRAIPGPQQNGHFSRDSTATLVNGYVLAAPVESDQLLCLRLPSGRLAWQRPLEDFRYVAAAADDVVLAVGNRSISGWKLPTGKPAWEELAQTLPDGAQTAGYGFLMGRSYYLPITGSALLQIDVATGRIEKRLSLPRQPGNVIAVGPMLISFSPEGVDAFGPPKP